MRAIDLIVIHCSASPNGRWVTASDIDVWHHQRGFCRAPSWRNVLNPQLSSIGYHFVIYTSGAIAAGRALDEIGAHVYGYNRASLGICLIGTDRFAPEQFKALSSLISVLRERYPRARICGHRDLSPDVDGDGLVEPWEWLKTCPGFDVAAWLQGGMAALPDHLITSLPKGK